MTWEDQRLTMRRAFIEVVRSMLPLIKVSTIRAVQGCQVSCNLQANMSVAEMIVIRGVSRARKPAEERPCKSVDQSFV